MAKLFEFFDDFLSNLHLKLFFIKVILGSNHWKKLEIIMGKKLHCTFYF